MDMKEKEKGKGRKARGDTAEKVGCGGEGCGRGGS